MKPTPAGWPRLSTTIFYADAPNAIDWLCRAFGFEVRLKVEGEGGIVEHSELVLEDALIMVGDTRRKKSFGPQMVSPRSAGAVNTQSAMLYIDDVDAHCARARAAGAEVAYEPTLSDYGEDYWADKCYQCVDLEGHAWWFCERVRG
jgi:uncharacterized glyoxalase superfamily protein PhnB